MAKEKSKKSTKQQETGSKWLIVVVVLAVVGFVGFKFIRWLNTPSDLKQIYGVRQLEIELREDDHVKGNSEAANVLIEYGDFECPGCSEYAPIINSFKDEFGDNLKIVYRHLPLTMIHPNALSSAYAAEAAGMQGKFWEMHDLLFLNQDEWSGRENPQEYYESYATELELDLEKFRTDMDSDGVKERVKRDLDDANGFNLSGTPSFILNKTLLSLPRSVEQFRQIIADEVNPQN